MKLRLLIYTLLIGTTLLVCAVATAHAQIEEGTPRLDIQGFYAPGNLTRDFTFPSGGADRTSSMVHKTEGWAIKGSFLLSPKLAIYYRGEFSYSRYAEQKYFSFLENGTAKEYRETATHDDANANYNELSGTLFLPALRHGLIAGVARVEQNAIYRGVNYESFTDDRYTGLVVGLNGGRCVKTVCFEYAGRAYPRMAKSRHTFGRNEFGSWDNPDEHLNAYGFELRASAAYHLIGNFALIGGGQFREMFTPRAYTGGNSYRERQALKQPTLFIGLG